jgi:hypothetical protein
MIRCVEDDDRQGSLPAETQSGPDEPLNLRAKKKQKVAEKPRKEQFA